MLVAVCVHDDGDESDKAALPATQRYTLRCHEGHYATVQDVHDKAARKAFAYDVYTSSSQELFDGVVRPLLEDLTTAARGDSELQGLVIVDGTIPCRRRVLLDATDGVLARSILCLQSLAVTSGVAALRLGAVRVNEDGQMVDLLAAPAGGAVCHDDSGGDGVRAEQGRHYCDDCGQAPCVVEEVKEQRTMVMGASSDTLTSDPQLLSQALRHLDQVSIEMMRPVIYSLVLEHVASVLTTPARYTLLQFVSMPADTDSQGMGTTRHLLNSAAVLRCCAAPLSVTLSESPLLFLLKPALLAQQPAVWISCFAPTCRSDADGDNAESFDAAFRVAQTAAHLYSATHKDELATLDQVLGEHLSQNDNPAIGWNRAPSSATSHGGSMRQADALRAEAAVGLIYTPTEGGRPGVPLTGAAPLTARKLRTARTEHGKQRGLTASQPASGAPSGPVSSLQAPFAQMPPRQKRCVNDNDGKAVQDALERGLSTTEKGSAAPHLVQADAPECNNAEESTNGDDVSLPHNMRGLLEIIQCQQDEIAEYVATIHGLRERVAVLEAEAADRDTLVESLHRRLRSTHVPGTLPARAFSGQRERGRGRCGGGQCYAQLDNTSHKTREASTATAVRAGRTIPRSQGSGLASPPLPSAAQHTFEPPMLGAPERDSVTPDDCARYVSRPQRTTSRSLVSPAVEPTSAQTTGQSVPQTGNATRLAQRATSVTAVNITSHRPALLRRIVNAAYPSPTFEDFMRTAPRYQLRYASSGTLR